MFFYVGLKFQVNHSSEGIETWVNRGCMNFVIYFILTCGLPICLGFFFSKDVAAYFGNLLILQISLMDCNIVYKCGKDS